MINIKFADVKPAFYGSTGVHLYSVEVKCENEDKEILVSEHAKAIDLYKNFFPIILFLSNEVDPYPGLNNENGIETYPIFGNPKHSKSLNPIPNDQSEFQLLGYLDVQDVKEVKTFFQKNTLYEREGIQNYYDGLFDEVKQQLMRCLGNKVMDELDLYFQQMVAFFNDCDKESSGVVIISNN